MSKENKGRLDSNLHSPGERQRLTMPLKRGKYLSKPDREPQFSTTHEKVRTTETSLHHKVSKADLRLITAAVGHFEKHHRKHRALVDTFRETVRAGSGSRSDDFGDQLNNFVPNLQKGPPAGKIANNPGSGFDPNYTIPEKKGDPRKMTGRSQLLEVAHHIAEAIRPKTEGGKRTGHKLTVEGMTTLSEHFAKALEIHRRKEKSPTKLSDKQDDNSGHYTKVPGAVKPYTKLGPPT